MRVDVSSLSISEIQERWASADVSSMPVALIRSMRRDPRAGVRRLGKAMGMKRKRARREKVRQDALLNFERVLWRSGIQAIAGVDEAGVGPLAGPVVAAAVVFPPNSSLEGIDDSKKLDVKRREELNQKIHQMATVGIGIAQPDEIDQINVYQASLLAMRRSVGDLPVRPQHLLVDARTIPDTDLPQNCFNKGDGLSFSIAAASIVAKVYRDNIMKKMASEYPGYGFQQHKGYATTSHQAAIRQLGPSPIHRHSYAFLRELCGEFSSAFYRLKGALDGAHSPNELRQVEKQLDREVKDLSEAEIKKLRLVLSRRGKALS